MYNLYLYFSGTGNTKHVVSEFAKHYEGNNHYQLQSMEYDNVDYDSLIKSANMICIAYPIHESMLPHLVSEFLNKYKESFYKKNIITICTQLLFSGDGGKLPTYILKDVNVQLLHSIHINMPNNITDVKFLPNKTMENSTKKVLKADKKIIAVVNKIKNKKTVKDGNKFYSWFLGFFVQRVYAKIQYRKLRSKVKIHHNQCINCKKCVDLCPTKNLFSKNNQIQVKDECTVCYRCVNECPTKAISIFTRKSPTTQYSRHDYN